MAGSEKSVLRTLVVVASIAIAAAVFVSASYEFSRERIAENERARLLERLATVLDAETAAREPVPVRLEAMDEALLGSEDPVDVYVMMDGETPVGTAFAAVAPDGYNAPIRLLVGISTDGTVTGVRVLSHRETPGLGDLIEESKSDWILQFDGTSVGAPAPGQWTVTEEGGSFDALTGATVTPRAVISAVHDTLRYFEMHEERLYRQARAALASGADSPDE